MDTDKIHSCHGPRTSYTGLSMSWVIKEVAYQCGGTLFVTIRPGVRVLLELHDIIYHTDIVSLYIRALSETHISLFYLNVPYHKLPQNSIM